VEFVMSCRNVYVEERGGICALVDRHAYSTRNTHNGIAALVLSAVKCYGSIIFQAGGLEPYEGLRARVDREVGKSGIRIQATRLPKGAITGTVPGKFEYYDDGLELGKLSAIRDKAIVEEEGILAVHTSPVSLAEKCLLTIRRVPHCSAVLFYGPEKKTVEHACTTTARVLPQLVNYSTQSQALLLPSHNTRPVSPPHQSLYHPQSKSHPNRTPLLPRPSIGRYVDTLPTNDRSA